MKRIIIFFLLSIAIHNLTAQSKVIDQLITQIKESASDTAKINLLNEIARAYQGSDLKQSFKFADSALQFSKFINYRKGIANASRNFGDINSDLGKYDKAKRYYQQSLDISEEIANSPLIIRSLNSLGNIQVKLGSYNLALEYYQKALHLAEKTNDKKMSSGIINNLAMIYFELGNYAKSIENFKIALKVNKELGEEMEVAFMLNNIGNVLSEEGKLEEAMASYQQSFAIAEKLENKMLFGNLHNNIGLIYFRRGNYREAKEHYEKAMQIAEEREDRAGIAILLGNLGDVEHAMGKYKEAVNYNLKSLEIAEDIGAKENKSFVYQNLSESYVAMANYKEAYKYLQLNKELEDSLSIQESKKQIAALYAKYQSEKRERENQLLKERHTRNKAVIQRQQIITITIVVILILVAITAFTFFKTSKQKQKDNLALQQQKAEIEEKNNKLILLNQEITQQNEENIKQKFELERLNYIKDKLFSIISHDFRSPLHSLQGTLTLLNANVLSTKEINKISYELVDKVDHASSLLDNLLNWAKSQLHGVVVNQELIDLSELTKENIDLLKPIADKKGVILENHINKPIEAYADKDMIKLVLRNLISNAIKFTSEGDKVVISAYRNETHVHVMVKDTGIGIVPEDKNKLFKLETYTTQGTANEKGTGLGLILCKDFIEKNNGKITFTSIKGEGSNFQFSLPIVG